MTTKAKRCGVCGQSIRTSKMIYVANGAKTMARKRVGLCCARAAVTILMEVGSVAKCSCGKPATTCIECARDAERKDPAILLRKAIAALRKLATAYADTDRAEGIKQAADILEGGKFQ